MGVTQFHNEVIPTSQPVHRGGHNCGRGPAHAATTARQIESGGSGNALGSVTRRWEIGNVSTDEQPGWRCLGLGTSAGSQTSGDTEAALGMFGSAERAGTKSSQCYEH